MRIEYFTCFFTPDLGLSCRYKDRTKHTSALINSESCVFRRALYHNWILSLLCRAPLDNDEDEDDEMDDGAIDANTSASFVRILSDLDDKSLSAVHQVRLFLDELLARIFPRQSYNPVTGELIVNNLTYSCQYTPQDLFNDFRAQNAASIFGHSPRALDAVTTGVHNLLEKREVLKTFEEKFKRQTILESVSEGYVGQCECTRCKQKSGYW